MEADVRYEDLDTTWPEEAGERSWARLHTAVFPETAPEAVRQRLAGRPRYLLQLAWAAGGVVGYKIGFEDSPAGLHSWLGAVAPAWRGRGIASALMDRQHGWGRTCGYRYVTTHTTNRWRDMLILDLRSGFDVIGTYTSEHGETKIMLAKSLA